MSKFELMLSKYLICVLYVNVFLYITVACIYFYKIAIGGMI